MTDRSAVSLIVLPPSGQLDASWKWAFDYFSITSKNILIKNKTVDADLFFYICTNIIINNTDT